MKKLDIKTFNAKKSSIRDTSDRINTKKKQIYYKVSFALTHSFK